MPDISLCINHTCPLAPKCYRHEAPASPFWQSYMAFKPARKVQGWRCDHFLSLTTRQPLPAPTGSCLACGDLGWVCESHPDRPWGRDLPGGCQCNAGMLCPECAQKD